MPKYILSTKADKDQDDIADYTLETWGEKQAQEYIVGLVDCLEKIAKTPDIGRDASEFSPNLKRFNYKAHSVFYMSTDTGILIVRILGQKLDFHRHL